MIANRYEQCRSSPTLGETRNAYRAPLMWFLKKRFLKRCCLSIIIRLDLVVVVIYLSQVYSTGGPPSAHTYFNDSISEI